MCVFIERVGGGGKGVPFNTDTDVETDGWLFQFCDVTTHQNGDPQSDQAWVTMFCNSKIGNGEVRS